MLNVQVKDDDIFLSFSRSYLSDRDLMDFIERIRAKHLIAESKLTEEDAIHLDEELKTNWWIRNKEKFLNKTK